MSSDTNILVRPVHPDDATALYEIVSDPAVTRSTVRLPSMEITETADWIKQQKPGKHRLVAVMDDRPVGLATLQHYQRPCIQHAGILGMIVHRDYWRQGVGSALMAAILDMTDNWLNLWRLELDVFTDNLAAVALYQKFGFEIEGTRRMMVFGGDGRFHDEYAMVRFNEPQVESREGGKSISFPRPDPRPNIDSLLIRPQHPDDVADMHALWRHPLVGQTTLQMPSQEISVAQRKIDNPPPGGHRLVAEVDGRVIGAVAMFQHQNPRLRHSAGLGMMVHPDYWGCGIGTRLMAAILDIADNWLNLKRVELEVNCDNPAAISLYKRFGFEIEGTKRLQSFGNGRWADTHFMARLKK